MWPETLILAIKMTKKHIVSVGRPASEMIACDCSTCSYELFHYGCVDITRAPKSRWFCSDCSKKQTKKWLDLKILSNVSMFAALAGVDE